MMPTLLVEAAIANERQQFAGGAIATSDSWSGGDLANITARNSDAALGGTAKAWLQAAGTTNGLGISGGRLVRQATGSARYVTLDPALADVLVETVVPVFPTTNALRLVCRCPAGVNPTTTDSCYGVSLDLNPELQLQKIVAGVVTNLAGARPPKPGDRIGLVAKGSRILMLVNDQIITEVIDTDLSGANTRAGFRISSSVTGFQLDNFIARAA